MTDTKWFDEDGNFTGKLPQDAIEECTVGGRPADQYVRNWVKELQFEAPRDMAIEYVIPFGAWDRDELESMTPDELNDLIFWLACGDMSEAYAEEGEEYLGWIGLVH